MQTHTTISWKKYVVFFYHVNFVKMNSYDIKQKFYTFYLQAPKEKQEFSMAMTSLADAIGITFAGLLAIPLHNKICALPKWNLF